MARKLPIGIQSFEKLRQDGFVYVDKTAYVYKLAQSGIPYFLSRPRRFGKSLLLSTLRAYFEGRRDLFEGLDIEQLEGNGLDAWQVRPVFHLDFNGANYSLEGGLEKKLDAVLKRWENTWDTDGAGFELGDRFYNLLEKSHAVSGHRASVLVDEYDKPLLESMQDSVLEERNRATLKSFFSVLKGADEHVKFVLITGVTKFSKVSIFSDLNQLSDISHDARFTNICGISETELLETFSPELNAMAEELAQSTDECQAALRSQYDGYCFHPNGPAGKNDVKRLVYNPFSVLKALDERRLGSYWFETGTPSFLVRRMRDSGLDPKRLTDGSLYATAQRLSDYRADDPDPIPLLYQTGYLTVRAYDSSTGAYELAVPNQEVAWGLVENLLPAYAPSYGASRGTDVFTLHRYVEQGDTNGIRHILEALFASIPYTRDSDPFENYFQAVLWLTFALLGRYVSCEVHQAMGRVDCIVETTSHVYVFEFKRDGTAAEALAQIEEQGYATAFAADPRKLHVIGCVFDSKMRLLSDWDEMA
ncbi:MAG: ATP-binding protein [Atopobiaceae bacterium]|nr:ATP-binding protein [Atopobiaceae bacterium]